MSSAVSLYDETGREVFRGTQRPAGGGSQPFRQIRANFAFNTPNLLTGILIGTLADGEALASYSGQYFTPTAFDGSTPTLHIGPAFGTDYSTFNGPFSLGSSDNTDGNLDTSQAPLWNNGYVSVGASPLVIWMDDGSGGDPSSMVGAGSIIIPVFTAP